MPDPKSFRHPTFRRCLVLLALLAVAAQALPPVAAMARLVGARAAEDPVPRLADAEAQLLHAGELRNAMRGLEGEARIVARARAVAACRAVRAYFPGESRACAEAAFRAGELLRAAGDLEGASAEFTRASAPGGDSPFRLRARLEVGHLDRRARALEKALASYEAVLADPAATPAQRDEASLWLGCVLRDLGRPADARRAWQRVADAGEDPLDRVRAFDHLACLLIEGADLEGAAGTLERCREALAVPAAEETRLGERVRSALQNMRAIDDLQRAIARKSAAPEGERARKPKREREDQAREKREAKASELFPSSA